MTVIQALEPLLTPIKAAKESFSIGTPIGNIGTSPLFQPVANLAEILKVDVGFVIVVPICILIIVGQILMMMINIVFPFGKKTTNERISTISNTIMIGIIVSSISLILGWIDATLGVSLFQIVGKE